MLLLHHSLFIVTFNRGNVMLYGVLTTVWFIVSSTWLVLKWIIVLGWHYWVQLFIYRNSRYLSIGLLPSGNEIYSSFTKNLDTGRIVTSHKSWIDCCKITCKIPHNCIVMFKSSHICHYNNIPFITEHTFKQDKNHLCKKNIWYLSM